MSKFDRFQPPTAADEKYPCQCCGKMFHYLRLNDDGLCADCRPEPIGHVEAERVG